MKVEYQYPTRIEIYLVDKGKVLEEEMTAEGMNLLNCGEIPDFALAVKVLKQYLGRTLGRSILKPSIVVCHPKEYDKEAAKNLKRLMSSSGIREVSLYPGTYEEFQEKAPEGFMEAGGYKGIVAFTQEEALVADSDAPIKQKMHNTELYLPGDEDLMREQTIYLEQLYDYNRTRPSEGAVRENMLKEMFAEIGEGCYIEPPFHANFGGHHVHFGSGIYANFNLTLVDDTHIYVGDKTMFGPNVVVATAGHPILPELREEAYQYNAPVHIGRNCWLGAGVIVLPGVSIGDNTVIGAGSVVTKDIPSGVVAVGNPCKVLRKINEHDKEYYFKDKKIL